MADVPTTLERERHDTMWSRSVSDTQRRLQDPLHDSVWLRKVAFCLPRSLIEQHWPRSSTEMTVEQLRHALEQLPFAVEQLVVYSEKGRLIAVVVSNQFEGLDEAERQRLIWHHLFQRFDARQITPIEFVFTNTPQEDAELAD
jgi:acid stress-induced BolA-like protein IbaG/YrbA